MKKKHTTKIYLKILSLSMVVMSLTCKCGAAELKLHFPFNEGDGGSSFEKLNDIEGTCKYLTEWSEGVSGKSMKFMSSGINNSSALVFPLNEDSFLNTFDGGPFTISMFIKPVDRGRKETHDVLSTITGSYGPGWKITIFYHRVVFVTGDGNTQQWSVFAGPPLCVIKFGEWNHIAVTRDSKGIMAVYLNGVKGEDSSNPLFFEKGHSVLTVGAYNSGYENAYAGSIDEIKIFQGTMSIREIKELYMTTLGIEPDVRDPVTEFSYFPSEKVTHPVYTNSVDIGGSFPGVHYAAAADEVIKMNDQQIIDALPKFAGIFYAGCPNCTKNPTEAVFNWNVQNPHSMACGLCGHVYPSEKFPDNKIEKVLPPSGKEMEYRYFQTKTKKHFFRAGIELRKRVYFENAAVQLGMKYYKTKDEKYAKKAAVILCNIARAYPDFAFHYDTLNQNPVFYNGLLGQKDMRAGNMTGRWHCWANQDIPEKLILCYDLIYNSSGLKSYSAEIKMNVQEEIEKKFFLQSVESVLLNRDDSGNLWPMIYRSLIISGRILNAPDYVHIALERFKKFLQMGFAFDGFWHEPSLSYHQQASASAFWRIFPVISGYSDPDGFRSKYSSLSYTNADPRFSLGAEIKNISRWEGLTQYPFLGRYFAMGDTWSSDRCSHTNENDSFLVPAAGFASLNSAANGRQTQLQLYWTFKEVGHTHRDALGISVFANNREIISDLGYTHTVYRPWTSSTPAHNTVVIDYSNQYSCGMKGRGNIIYMDIDNPQVQIVHAEQSMMNNSNIYQRVLFLIDKKTDKENTAGYIVDFFEAGGGKTYDYFIHGDADKEDNLQVFNDTREEAQSAAQPLIHQSLIGKWVPPANEDARNVPAQYYYYGFLRDTKTVKTAGTEKWHECRFTSPDDGSGFSLYVPVIPKEKMTLGFGKSPSVRQGGHSDNTVLEKYFRKFVMIRKEGKETCRFTTVIEPFNKSGSVKNIGLINEGAVMVEYGNDTDIIFINQKKPINITINGQKLTAAGDYGFVSVREGKITSWHIVNGSIVYGSFKKQTVKALTAAAGATEGNEIRLSGKLLNNAHAANTGTFIKVLHGNGLTHGYFRDTIDVNVQSIRVKDTLGFIVNERTGFTEFAAFPQYRISGLNTVFMYPVSFGKN